MKEKVMLECKECGSGFESIRKTAIFCSPKCRKEAWNRVSVPEKVSVPSKSGVSVPERCHGCKKEVGGLICICLECVSRGVKHEDLSIRCPAWENRDEIEKGGFVPNWKRIGLKAKEEGLKRILMSIFRDKQKILKRSMAKEAVFVLGDRLITLK